MQTAGTPAFDSEGSDNARPGQSNAPQAEARSPNKPDGVQPRIYNISDSTKKVNI